MPSSAILCTYFINCDVMRAHIGIEQWWKNWRVSHWAIVQLESLMDPIMV